MTDKLLATQTVAVVGCGYWGKNLVRVFSQLGALKCVCDNDAARFAALAIPGDPPVLTQQLADVLANPDIRGVAVATPAATHYDVVAECLQAGKDVFVEKPMALAAEQGEKLVALAQRNARILMVGHILLYHPAVAKLKQLIDQGALGRILYCYSNRLNIGLIRTEENILWSFAPHDISVMLYLLGEEPVSAEAEGQSYLTPGVVDVTLSRLRFRSGVTGHIFVSWLHPSKEQKFVVVGTEQMAVFDDTAAQKLVLYPHRVDWQRRVPKAVKAEAIAVDLPRAEPLREECQHFLDCMATRRTPLSDGDEGLRVLRVLNRCQQSLEGGIMGTVPTSVAGTDGGTRLRVALVGPKSGTVPLEQTSAAAAAAPQEYFVHESAYVDQPCSIGKGTKIWHFSHVMRGATIGEKCVLGQNVVVGSAAVIGNGVKIQNNVSIYDAVTLADNVFCGPSVVFTNVLNPRSEIVRKHEYRPTLIRRGATLGANCTIVCGHTVGRYAFIAAGAVVADNVPAYGLMAGVPARQIGWMCRCASGRLQFDSSGKARCAACGVIYRKENGEVVETTARSPLPSGEDGQRSPLPPGEG